MEGLSIRITRREGDTEQTIDIGCLSPAKPAAATSTLVVEGAATAEAIQRAMRNVRVDIDTSNDAEQLVEAEPPEMQEALAELSRELGCANTLDDMLRAIDALRTQAPAKLEWSNTLCNGERVDYAAAEKACAALGEGWRLPTRMELESILDLTRHEPAIDTVRFPDTQSGAYWTSTPCAWSSDRAWIVYFHYGFANGFLRDGDYAFVRAVRSVPAGQ